MNDKDKEAFDNWFIEKYRYHYNRLVIPESVNPQKEAWKAACEYKEAENKKLRECLERYSKFKDYSISIYAIEALKERSER
jgi:hypothetical protein